VLDVDVNQQSLPGLPAAIRTENGQTWYSVAGSVDPQRRIPL